MGPWAGSRRDRILTRTGSRRSRDRGRRVAGGPNPCSTATTRPRRPGRDRPRTPPGSRCAQSCAGTVRASAAGTQMRQDRYGGDRGTAQGPARSTTGAAGPTRQVFLRFTHWLFPPWFPHDRDARWPRVAMPNSGSPAPMPLRRPARKSRQLGKHGDRRAMYRQESQALPMPCGAAPYHRSVSRRSRVLKAPAAVMPAPIGQ